MAYYDAGKQSNSAVAPVGIAYEMAYKERPDIALHHPDGTHPGLLGTYLGSCVVFSMITNSSPEGLKYNYLDQISDDDLSNRFNHIMLKKSEYKKYIKSMKLDNEDIQGGYRYVELDLFSKLTTQEYIDKLLPMLDLTTISNSN